MTYFPIETRDQKAVLAIALTFSILAIIAVSLRFVAHAIARKKWTVSDYFVIAACIFALSLQSTSIASVLIAGLGYDHVANIVPVYGVEPVITLSQLIVPFQLLWVLSLSCTKMSILCLYLQIFPFRWLVWSVYAIIAVIFAWTLGTILATFLICRPFAFNWDRTIPGGSCGDQVTSFTVTGTINLVTDVMVLLLPMQPVYQLQMAVYKKVTLSTLFGLGTFTCVISALRISVLPTMDFADVTITASKTNILSGIEPCVALIIACVPLMRPLLGRRVATPYGSRQRPVNSESKSTGPKEVSDDGFERLDDDTNRLWLRPMGVQHHAYASALDETMAGNMNEGDGNINEVDDESLDRHEVNGPGIKVQKSFQVSERTQAANIS